MAIPAKRARRNLVTCLNEKLCRSWCGVGWTVALGNPMAVVICLSTLATALRFTRMPAAETKNAVERGVGQRRSRVVA